MIFMPFIVIAALLAGGVFFIIQSVICDKVRDPRLRRLPMWIVGGALLVCSLLWLFGIPTTVFITGPGKLAVYDHIILAIILALSFAAMEAAWLVHKRDQAEVQQPLYGKGVWYAILTVVFAIGGGAFSELFEIQPLTPQIWTAVILGVILLVNGLYRFIKFRQISQIRGFLVDVSMVAVALLLEELVVTLLPETAYLTNNLKTALGTTAAVYLILSAVFQFVLNQDDRPGVFAMLHLLVKVLAYVAAAAMLLWIIAYQVHCDDNKSFLMALAFFGPILLGMLMGYLQLLRRNGSLQFENVKAQGTVHGLLPVALLLLCFLSGAAQFSNMDYRHEVRSLVTYWEVIEMETEPGKVETVLSLDLTARDQASDMQALLREEIDGRIELTLVGRWRPFWWPWEFKTMFVRIPADGSITQVCVNEEYVSSHSVVLRYDPTSDTWYEAR